VQLSATVNPPRGRQQGEPGTRDPQAPVERVERRLPDGRWVDAHEYQDALANLSNEDALANAQADADGAGAAGDTFTIRIYLADWSASRSLTARSYASTSACGRTYDRWGSGCTRGCRERTRDSYDDAIEFYLAAPLRYTLGLHGRQHRAAGSVRAALNQLYAADQRYNRAPKWSIRSRYANTNIPAFRISPHRRGSAPTDRALERAKCPAERPASLRGLTLREAREQVELVSEALRQAAARSTETSAASPRDGLGPLNAGAAMRAGP